MSAPFRYARKMLLVDPDSWERLSTRAGPNGLPPDVTLKRDYQKFLENKIASENQTNKEWNQFSNRVEPIIAAGVKKGTDSGWNAVFKSEFQHQNIQNIGVKDALSLTNALRNVPEVTLSVEENKIYVNNEQLAEFATKIIFDFLRPSAHLTDSMLKLLRKIVSTGNAAIASKMKNRQSIAYLRLPPVGTPIPSTSRGSGARPKQPSLPQNRTATPYPSPFDDRPDQRSPLVTKIKNDGSRINRRKATPTEPYDINRLRRKGKRRLDFGGETETETETDEDLASTIKGKRKKGSGLKGRKLSNWESLF